MNRLYIYIIFAIIAIVPAMAQRDASNIQRDKERNANEIKETSRRLDKKASEINSQLNQLNLVEAEIDAYNDTIDAIQKKINNTAHHIAVLNDSITRTEHYLQQMRQKYAKAVRKLQSGQNDISTLSFIFSAESFTQAYRRMRYMSQFSKWRQRKVDEIEQIQSQLNTRHDHMAKLQLEQQLSRQLVVSTRQKLVEKRNETDKIIVSLKSEEKALKKLLKQKEQEAQNLDRELERLIAEEQRKAEEARLAEERRKAEEAEKQRQAEQERIKKQQTDSIEKVRKDSTDKPADKTTKPETETKKQKQTEPKSQYQQEIEAERRLTGKFEDNKGQLLFPVTGKYKIVRKFGRHAHPTLKYVKTDNSGIDIEALSGGKARAVFNGTVSAIFRQPGFNNIVMIRHGSYISIYANIKNLTVKKGDTVKTGTILGDIYADPDDNNRAIMHFEIRHEREKLNPELWVK